MKKDKIKVLTVCALGRNRSKYLASYLKNKGYLTRFGGVHDKNLGFYNPIKQDDIDWADFIIITRKRLGSIFKKKFKVGKKEIILIDVTDSKRIIGEKYPDLGKLDYLTFQKKWTRPKLREAIKPYLPLKLK